MAIILCGQDFLWLTVDILIRVLSLCDKQVDRKWKLFLSEARNAFLVFKEDEVGCACSTNGREVKSVYNFGGKTCRIRPFAVLRSRYEN